MHTEPHSNQTLLIIDDDEVFTRVLSRALGRRGYHIVTAANGTDAIAALEEQAVDKAIVDLKIARESGLQLIPTLKQVQPSLAIVMLTGYSSITTAVEAIKLGAVNYLCKPADTDEILAAFDAVGGNPDTAITHRPPSVDRLEWEHIQKVLAEHDGNISATARALGMHRRTLQRKLQKRPVRH
ncbi:response regulator transcription factor [Exilibacterium tricleocarpae]|uniref:Response regulator transcription factor n=1 Tax=Exilibacterium tricleocarpae TaxID=2591008 RepID=A0A545TSC1_9GAMM|nr:response regulator transcription factor [Exilibacterium tricleocarpae]TQV80120.1 response regulator transcription factor [Exilibacterium tricleocarpae]